MSKKEELEKLKEKMIADKTVPLREGATNLVFGEGNPETKILMLGEGPGFHEHRLGRPFVGNAGSVLNKLLESINLKREDVFITNMVFYTPPNNQNPEPHKLPAFSKYMDQLLN